MITNICIPKHDISLYCPWTDIHSGVEGMHVQQQPLGGRCESSSAFLQPAESLMHLTQDEGACQEVCPVKGLGPD